MRIAIDTCVLLNRAADEGYTIEAFEVISRRLPNATFVVTPTVLHELAGTYDADQQRIALSQKALTCLRVWGIQPVNLVPVGHGITERIARSIREQGLLPDREVNDSLIIAEAALCGCDMLLSADRHCRDAGQAYQKELWQILDGAHATTTRLAILTPYQVAKMYNP